jgi:hypothetical protein
LDAKGVMEPYQEPRDSRGWLTLALGVLVFAVFGAVVGYAWFRGLPGVGGEPPLIRAEAGPYRHAPEDRGGLEVANASSSIVNVLRPEAEPPRVERLLPPETPMALEEDDPMPPAESPAPAPAGEAPPPVAEPPAAAAADVPPAPETAAPADQAALAPLEADVPAATDPAEATPAPTALPMPVPKPQVPRQLAAREPPATISAMPRTPAAATPQRATPPAPSAPQRPARVEPAATTAARPPAPPPRARGGEVYRLQLTAVRSENSLTQAWAQLKQRYPQALAGASPRIERTETTTGPLFRLQAGPFTSREAAVNACTGIRSAGGQCFIVGPVAP